MKYVSFLGAANYNNITYTVDGKEITTEFFQNIVMNIQSEIDEIFILTTEVGKSKHFDKLNSSLILSYPNLNIHWIIINDDENVEEMIAILNEIQELKNEPLIMDVTHCFRTSPFRIMMLLKHLEDSLNLNIKHLYYGKIDENIGEILDIYVFYKESEISDSLRQFDQTLKLHHDEYIHESNQMLDELLKNMSYLNGYLELADLKNSILCIENISNLSKQLIDQNLYYRLNPYFESIVQKFSTIMEAKDELKKQYDLIKLLTKHRYYQVATTFVYNAYEKWLEDYLDIYNLEEFKSNWIGKTRRTLNDGILKGLSKKNKNYKKIRKQRILDLYNSGERNQYKCPYVGVSEKEEFYYMPYLLNEFMETVHYFSNNIRNNFNHGSVIDEENISNWILKMNDTNLRLYAIEKYKD